MARRLTRKLVIAVLALAFAGATMGQDGCETDPPSGGEEASEQNGADREAAREKRRAKKRRARERRERARERRERRERQRERRERRERSTPPPTEEARSDCHPSYKGACLDPGASDYDCEGGSGDGPKYTGPVTVVGEDPYDLDRDGDGSACE